MEKQLDKYLRSVRRRLNMPKELKDRVMTDFTGSLEGLTLCLPIEDDSTGCSEMYTVRRGDTLDTISQRYLMISDRLMMANPDLTVQDFSKVGTMICIPK